MGLMDKYKDFKLSQARKRTAKLNELEKKTKIMKARRKARAEEQAVIDAYKKEKKKSFDSSTTGKIWNAFKTEVKKKQKANRSSGLFADEARSTRAKGKKKTRSSESGLFGNDDYWKKWE